MDDSAIAGAHPPIQPQIQTPSFHFMNTCHSKKTDSHNSRKSHNSKTREKTQSASIGFYLDHSIWLRDAHVMGLQSKGGFDCKKQILTIQHTPLSVLNFTPINMYFTPDTWQASRYSPNNPTFKTIQLFEN
jgi:hypothetical protein